MSGGIARASLAFVSLLGMSCDRRETPPGAGVRVPEASRTAIAPLTDASHGPKAVVTMDVVRVGDAGSEEPGAAGGEWGETTLYRLRLDELRPCTTISLRPDARRTAARRVGALVRVVPKVGALLVSERDFTLGAGGVILQSDSPGSTTVPACAPAFRAKVPRAGQAVRGFVVFSIPEGFNADAQPVMLTYRPTRWGGAPHVDTRLPACLESCDPDAAGPPKTARPRLGRRQAR